MVSDKRVFPTKENTWVSLARKPMIADSKELEKIFKPHKHICLLHLPPAEKKNTTRNKQGSGGMLLRRYHSTTQHQPITVRCSPTAERAFNEKDRASFMDICGIRLLSQCVKTEPQTESLRPCPSMQALVRSVIPHLQKFLYHHEELAGVYSELMEEDIGQKIKRLNYAQVR